MNLVGTLGKMLLNNAMSGSGGGGNVLGSLLGGASGGAAGGAGGLGSLLSGLAGGAGGSAGGAGGLGALLGQLQGGGAAGGSAGAGGIGELLGGMLGGSSADVGASGQAGGLGSLLGAALGQQSAPAATPAPQEQNDHAALLIRAMVNAAKCDGTVDAEEQEKIVGQLGDIGQEEANFIRSEMSAPLDLAGFIASIPNGMGHQVYLLSLMAINLDSRAEANYLDQLAKGLGISEQTSNQLHQEVGAPPLYS